eukprot:jgi/Tetstr1/446533/TSEL_034058.t1
MRKDMRKHIAQHIQPMLRPLTEFVPEKAHEIMAMHLDPRYCKGNLFKLMLGKQEEARELIKEYDDKSLLPALVQLSKFLRVQTMMMTTMMEMPCIMTMVTMNLDNMGACVLIQKNLDLDAKVKELLASYYGEAAYNAVAADILKPCGEDWLASQVLDGEGEGEASCIQWEAVESMLEQYGAEPADEEAGD